MNNAVEKLLILIDYCKQQNEMSNQEILSDFAQKDFDELSDFVKTIDNDCK